MDELATVDEGPCLSACVPSVSGMTYWINTVSRGHVERGKAGGFTQANHGKPHPLRRMAKDDWIAFYSPKTDYPDGAPLQAFTALGQVCDDEIFQVDVPQVDREPAFQPWRRRVRYLDVIEAPVRPLIDGLGFITDRSNWGVRFRSGLFAIDQRDFEVIRDAMAP